MQTTTPFWQNASFANPFFPVFEFLILLICRIDPFVEGSEQ